MKTLFINTLLIVFCMLLMPKAQGMVCTPHLTNDSVKIKIDTTAVAEPSGMDGDTLSEQTDPPLPWYHREDGQTMNGMIIPDYEDSTILLLAYGAYSRDTGGSYYFNAGPALYDEHDSVLISTEIQYSDDSTVIIYARGQRSNTLCCHNIFTEDAIILDRVDSGWQVVDSREDQFVPDFRSLDYLGTYGSGHFLMRREMGGMYAWGFEASNEDYFLISRNSLNGQVISFELSHSDIMTGNCDSSRDHSNGCNCYQNAGSSEYSYDSIFDCIKITYSTTDVVYQCGMTDPVSTLTTQIWYMNDDTVLLASDNDSIAKGEIKHDADKLIWKPGERKSLHMSRKQIEKALNPKGRRKRDGFTPSDHLTSLR